MKLAEYLWTQINLSHLGFLCGGVVLHEVGFISTQLPHEFKAKLKISDNSCQEN